MSLIVVCGILTVNGYTYRSRNTLYFLLKLHLLDVLDSGHCVLQHYERFLINLRALFKYLHGCVRQFDVRVIALLTVVKIYINSIFTLLNIYICKY